jgi:lipoprotein-anchoring transpeptidase ErfK/SrfK
MAATVVIVSVIAVFLIYGAVMQVKTSQPVMQTDEANADVKAQAPGESESDYFAAAADYNKKNDLVGERDSYRSIIEKYPGSANIAKAQEALDNLNIRILFSSALTPDSFLYEVRKGDALTKIARKFNTTIELISKANGLKDTNVRIGQKLKVPKAKFSIIVDKSQNILTLKADHDIVKTYQVSTGKNSCTPVGTFKITNKLIDPPWYPSAGGMIPAKDPKNVLGSRWMGISKQGYGIHGTIEPESIGKSVTEGCVRMKNSEVEDLYSIVPIGTEVIITD